MSESVRDVQVSRYVSPFTAWRGRLVVMFRLFDRLGGTRPPDPAWRGRLVVMFCLFNRLGGTRPPDPAWRGRLVVVFGQQSKKKTRLKDGLEKVNML